MYFLTELCYTLCEQAVVTISFFLGNIPIQSLLIQPNLKDFVSKSSALLTDLLNSLLYLNGANVINHPYLTLCQALVLAALTYNQANTIVSKLGPSSGPAIEEAI